MKKSILYGACGILAAAALVLMAAGTTLASTITVLNPSFESPDASEDTDQTDSADSWVSYTGGVFYHVNEIPPFEGEQVGWLNDEYMYQNTVPIQEGLTYTLQVYVRKRNDLAGQSLSWPTDFRVELRTSEDKVLSTVTVSDPGTDDWELVTVSYLGMSIDDGKTLRIWFQANEPQATFDMVSLTAVPIPSAVWLLGSGLFCIVGIRRKFRK